MCFMTSISCSSSNEQLLEEQARTFRKLLLCFCSLNYNLLFLCRYWSVCSVVKVNIVQTQNREGLCTYYEMLVWLNSETKYVCSFFVFFFFFHWECIIRLMQTIYLIYFIAGFLSSVSQHLKIFLWMNREKKNMFSGHTVKLYSAPLGVLLNFRVTSGVCLSEKVASCSGSTLCLKGDGGDRSRNGNS